MISGFHFLLRTSYFLLQKKPTGKGTGLGLSLAYDIIKAHGGTLKVETKQKEETVFIISLPVN